MRGQSLMMRCMGGLVGAGRAAPGGAVDVGRARGGLAFAYPRMWPAAAARSGPHAPRPAAAAGVRVLSDAPPAVGAGAGAGSAGTAPPGAKPEPEFDPELLRALEIDHIPPSRIADALRSENITIDQLKMLVDEGFHLSPEGRPGQTSAAEQAALSRNATEWSQDLVHQLNPRRRFFPGQTYLPEELSPHYEVDYVRLREEQRKLGCPLGGKKGPKIDYTNVALLSRFVSEGGQITPRRKTMVCAKKQRELKRNIKRARTMNLIPYKSKLPQFQKTENPFVDS